MKEIYSASHKQLCHQRGRARGSLTDKVYSYDYKCRLSVGSAYTVTYSQTLVINVSCISTGPIINSNRDAHSDARDYSSAWLHVPKIHVPISTPYLRLVCLMYACPLGCSAFYHILVPCSLLLSFKKKVPCSLPIGRPEDSQNKLGWLRLQYCAKHNHQGSSPRARKLQLIQRLPCWKSVTKSANLPR